MYGHLWGAGSEARKCSDRDRGDAAAVVVLAPVSLISQDGGSKKKPRQVSHRGGEDHEAGVRGEREAPAMQT